MTTAMPLRGLVVDDEALVRQATARGLAQQGFSCDVAADARQALELLQSQTFDVAVVDLRMPEINGHALILEMLEMPDQPAIIVLTGVPEPKLVKDLLARGVEDFMAKPANYDLLVLKAKALSERRRSNIESLKQTSPVPADTTSDNTTDDSTAARRTRSEAVTDRVKLARETMTLPPSDYDGFRIASGDSFGIEDLSDAIESRPIVAGDVLLMANCMLFRAAEQLRQTELIRQSAPPFSERFFLGIVTMALLLGAVLGFLVGVLFG